MHELLSLAIKYRASDLHISSDANLWLRIDGKLQIFHDIYITYSQIKELFLHVYPTYNEIISNNLEIDFAYDLQNVGRFRVNIFKKQNGVAGTFRLIPNTIPTLEELGMPAVFYEIAKMHRGLVLITGPTGSGKSTTLAAMIHHINQSCHKHIITLEDPIEFIHSSQQCLISQREVGRDTKDFVHGLNAALRQDPNIILVGELRDLNTIRLALTAAETGHLVFGTLHTMSAIKTITRIVDAFPSGEQNWIRASLADTLQVVISQILVNKTEQGRVAAIEIMISNIAIRNLIVENKLAQIYSVMQTMNREGMQTLDQCLTQLVSMGIIDKDLAQTLAYNKKSFTDLH